MKFQYFKFFCIASIVLFVNSVSAQTEITNTVVDFSTQMPIESASVYIENTTIGTVTNTDGKFLLSVPDEHINDTLVISSIGYKSFRTPINNFDESFSIYLEEDVASLDEVLIVAETRPKTGNEIVVRALEELEDNLPNNAYLQKGFLRHKERNKKEYKWLIESAITLYDSSYATKAEEFLKVNVDENRKSYDLRDVDSVFTYYSYLKNNNRNFKMKSSDLRKQDIKTESLIKAIKWNDERINGLENLFKTRLNLVRNSNTVGALFGKNVLEKHQFKLDTVLVDDGRKIYKIEIDKGEDFVGLNTPGVYNEGFAPKGWIYIYWDNFAIKKVEYELVAASDVQKKRSKSLFGTTLNHKLVLTYKEFQDEMYPSYIYYETPKLVNVGDRSSDKLYKDSDKVKEEEEEQFYYTTQEILFTEIIQEPQLVQEELKTSQWSEDIFLPRPYNKEFWKNYNVLLESEEEEKLIMDLSQRAELFKQ
ncbi:carboxypeptidase-like regulatory domain-containing protein [Marinirhabdus gelatinilytica]|uniref:Carboxypeptidase-like protein n=1 Tax=Marinirhabdus gelatinilytica TaxID=1703343 RepID=A0A370Q935_9FLAO|nr:carboxypeptidase-like regulatory domain-containing protein [Marinirhabdus gelatinilytica]RDK84868.1 carboxypeptidase-like protein [Marinirhabdus gelatinilytica]